MPHCSHCLGSILLTTAMPFLFACATAAAEEGEKPKESPIARVLGKPIYEKDLELDEHDKTPLRNRDAIARLIIPPLREKYIKDHKLGATKEEINRFRKWMLAGSTDEDETPDDIEALDEIDRASVEEWKFDKALYEKYGGRVEFQQAGVEPVDAYRDWLCDEEDAARFKIVETKWKEAFWEYFRPRYHRHLTNERDPFKMPPWEIGHRKRR